MIVQPIEAVRNLAPLPEAPVRVKPDLAIVAPEPGGVRLIGREREFALLTALVDHASDTGSALVLRGAPGTGKSTMAGALVAALEDRQVAALGASGNRAEASLPYAGLHQLLRPILGMLSSLPRPQRRAIEAAFGIAVSPSPDPFLIAIATLDLLSMAASPSLVVVVDDAHWLDRPTSEVLSFVARRLSTDRIVLLLTARDDRRSPILEAGIAELALEGLRADDAVRLLADVAPDIPASVRDRLIEIAAGNPLALVELPVALSTDQRTGRAPLPDTIPLTPRLDRAVAGRLRNLPVATRRLLHVLALGDGGEVADLLAAYQTLHPGDPAPPDGLLPAVAAGIVVIHEGTVSFRDHLVRAAVQGINVAGRRPARRTPPVASFDMGRGMRHAVASTVGRGQHTAAHGQEPGRSEIRGHPAAAAEASERDGLRKNRLALMREAGLAAIVDGTVTIDLVRMAEAALDERDDTLARRLLWTAAQQAMWEIGGDDGRDAVRGAAARLGAPGDDPWLLAISAAVGSADPASISEAAARFEQRDAAPTELMLAGIASAIAGDAVRSRSLLARAAPMLQGEGDRMHLAQLLVVQAWNDIHLGRWTEAASEIENGAGFARQTGQTMWSLVADVTDALLAAMRGDAEQVESALERVGPAAIGPGNGWVASTVESIRGIRELSTGSPELAFTRLRERIGSSASPPSWVIDHFADAAVLSGRVEEGRVVLDASGSQPDMSWGPLLVAARVYVGAVLADDETADERQRLAIDDLVTWPIHQARLQLHRGRWLRRHRRVADSRAPLRAARDVFETIGATTLAERARRELRASGERIRRRDATAWDQLSPQESEIAHMAAVGLSNREIGERLYLSHRTVGAHLYRIFPKLGVTSRGQLHTVLAALDSQVE